jgi:hypothetical protein
MWSNYAASVDAPIPRVFHIADHRRRATEQRPWLQGVAYV